MFKVINALEIAEKYRGDLAKLEIQEITLGIMYKWEAA